MTPSTAPPSYIETYTAGECHVFAVALHRKFGWQIEVVRDENEVWWQDEQDADNFIPSVVHVYAIDAFDNAWDIRGVRPASQIHEECQEMFNVDETSGDTCRSECELDAYIGSVNHNGEDVELPLGAFNQKQVDEALLAANQFLAVLPGYGLCSRHANFTHSSSIHPNTQLARCAMGLATELGVPEKIVVQSVARALGKRGLPVGFFCYFVRYMENDSEVVNGRELVSVGGQWIDPASSHESLHRFIQPIESKINDQKVSGSTGVDYSIICGNHYDPWSSTWSGPDNEPSIDHYASLITAALNSHQMQHETAPAPGATRAPRF